MQPKYLNSMHPTPDGGAIHSSSTLVLGRRSACRTICGHFSSNIVTFGSIICLQRKFFIILFCAVYAQVASPTQIHQHDSSCRFFVASSPSPTLTRRLFQMRYTNLRLQF